MDRVRDALRERDEEVPEPEETTEDEPSSEEDDGEA
jgi:hypothetical protein